MWIVQQAKERSEKGDFKEWLAALSQREKDHLYFYLLPRSRGFDIDPEKWVCDIVDTLKEEQV